MKTITLALAIGALACGAAASADPRIDARQLNQERRIDAGVRSGKLTSTEAARLKAQQAGIKEDEARMRAAHGGKLTARDKQMIRARQDSANARILKQKHDAERGKNHLKIG